MTTETSAIELPVEVSAEAEKPFDAEAYLQTLEDKRDGKTPELDVAETPADEPEPEAEPEAVTIDEKAVKSEPVDIEKAIEELSAEYAYDGEIPELSEPEPPMNEEAKLLQEYEQLSKITEALANAHPAVGLPPLEYNGKSLYEMNATEQNDYLTHLADQGRMKDAFDASKALEQFQANVQQLSKIQRDTAASVEAYNQKQAAYESQKDIKEWETVGKLFTDKIPMDDATQGKVHDYVVSLLQTNPQAQQIAKTPKGKGVILKLALEKAGVFDQLRSKEQVGDKAPSVPDASISNKKVPETSGEHIYSDEEIGKMSDAQYQKVEAVILKQMAEGKIRRVKK